jgi:type I restriction enzyme, S subunit
MNEDLPEQWLVTTIDQVTTNIIQRQPQQDENFIYIDIGSIDREKKYIVTPQKMLGKDAPSRARKVVQTGDVIVSTTRPNLNAVAMVTKELNGQIASTGFDVLRAPNIDPRWLFYIVRTTDFVQTMSELVQGALYPAIRSKDVRSFEIPFAPLNEQKRIADKLDRLLAKVDNCRERLDQIPLIIKKIRQSILSSASRGHLTTDWREDNSTLVEIDSEYGAIPASWKWKLTKEVGRVQLGRQRAPKYHSGKNMRPYLRVQNVYEDRIDLSDVMEMDFSAEDFERYQLHFGDILLNEGQSPIYLGRPAMYRDELPGVCFTNSLIRFRAFDFVDSDFALFVFRHYLHCGRFQQECNITTNIAHLSAGRFSNVEFPLPPLEEQHEIVRRAKKLFAFADRLEARYKTARAQIDKLTPALLDKAFKGELVPQDPIDEPAAALLAKIHSKGTLNTKPTSSDRSAKKAKT